MARLCRHFLSLLGLVFLAAPALGEALHTSPVLRLDPGMHTAAINRADMDAAGAFVVTGSDDKTVRVWSGRTGRLLDTIPLPAGAGNVGKVFAVAISPDGALIAAGGWLGSRKNDVYHSIYLFDRKTREPVARVDGLPDVALHLAFSPDGRRLVACLGGANGMRLYDRTEDWRELVKDADYGGRSYGAAFASDGRFATTSYDGKLRLYGPEGRLLHSVQTGQERPFGVAFHPDGTRIAVGYNDSTAVDVFSASDLKRLHAADTAGLDNGNLSKVAWSRDGARLHAAGRYRFDGKHPVLAWGSSGKGARVSLGGGAVSTVMSLVPFPNGDLLVTSQDPRLARIDAKGGGIWADAPVQADFRAQERDLLLSRDGTKVGFGYEVWGAEAAWFDVSRLLLTREAAQDLTAPDQTSLPVTGWEDRFNPGLAGTALELERYERSRSLAIRPDRQGFVLGTEWSLRAYDAEGKQLWRRAVPGIVWAVNISDDGRYVVAAYGDGTIRWHRPEDGAELLAFFPFADRRNWVVWEPQGYHFSTPEADRHLKWLVNRGWDQVPDLTPVSAHKGYFAPEVVKLVLQTGDIDRALERVRGADRARVPETAGIEIPDDAQLHVLTVGVSKYRDHEHLSLDYADDDAADLADHLHGQSQLYKVSIEGPLLDDLATKRRILSGLRKMSNRMRPDREDVAVIAFSGHGTRVNGEYYLLPHDVDASSAGGIEDTALSLTELIRRVRQMSERGKVIVFLDACHSGSVVEGAKDALPPDIADVRRRLREAGNGAIVVTSSTDQQISREDKAWQNGAFTEAILEALGTSGDADKDGWITMSELNGYVVKRVQAMTKFDQTPVISVPDSRYFEARLFRTR